MFAFLAGEALRDIARAGRVAACAVVLIALSVGILGGFWIFSLNLGAAVARWREELRIVVYLKEEPAAFRVSALMDRVRSTDGVARVQFVSRSDALQALKNDLGAHSAVADALPENPLLASIEVTPVASVSTAEATRALVERLSALPEVDEVQGGIQWVEQLARWRRMLQLLGLGVSGLLALGAVLTVTTATTLVVHARRHDIEIMRLCGASEVAIQLPLLLQGLIQGLLGATIALVVLFGAYWLARPWVEPMLHLALGLPRMTFLSAAGMAALLGGGTLLGGLAAGLARGRA